VADELPFPLAPGSAAVITGGASGIGLATARYLAERGLKVAIADLPGKALEEAKASLAATGAYILAVATDVSDRAQVAQLRDRVIDRFGEVAFLMNNAGTRSTEAKPWEDAAEWRRVLETNLWGVMHGVQAFVPGMLGSKQPGLVVNTGSKQGITHPPGRSAYNLSKAALNSFTTMLAHELRLASEGRIGVHLLIPGFVWTGISGASGEKPASAWAPDEVPPFLFDRIAAGSFTILCPDNDVDRTTDEARIRWMADDMIFDRPALSRWHPDHAEDFARFVADYRASKDS
jgi:NAD(P)-dependent dehydrogenase (short-subunit alcohol dehydrogenase family)